MLYKYLFSILCWNLNLNQKKKKIEFGRLPVKPAGKPVKPAGKSVQPIGKPVQTDFTAAFEFKFEFDRFRPVTGLTGPVNRNRRPAVTVAEPPELSRLKCAGYHHKGNTSSNALQTEQFLVCRVTSRYNHRFSDRTSIPRTKASPEILQPQFLHHRHKSYYKLVLKH